MKKIISLLIISLFLAGCTQNEVVAPLPTPIPMNQNQINPPDTKPLPKSAILQTSLGDITVELYPDKAPVTVANFAALAEGTITWIDPQTGAKKENVPYYQNIIFHRIIKGFMIQGGDLTGTGRGGPGYQFKDEFDPNLTFTEPGILAMANSGPNTNGSQFFITTAPATWLNGKHTIFGKVTAGMEVVTKIENVATGANDKPTTDVVLKQITVVR